LVFVYIIQNSGLSLIYQTVQVVPEKLAKMKALYVCSRKHIAANGKARHDLEVVDIDQSSFNGDTAYMVENEFSGIYPAHSFELIRATQANRPDANGMAFYCFSLDGKVIRCKGETLKIKAVSEDNALRIFKQLGHYNLVV